jgi:Raf kinase inhibitor-like YbhB/YbcL family protein
VVQHRFIKPSEAFKNGPQRLPDPCAGAQSNLLDECIAVQAANEVRDERLWNCGTRSKTGMYFTLKGETERCAMRVRFADVACSKQVFPRQYVCDTHRSSDRALSPALEWRDAPADAQSFVVTVEDASSPRFDDQGKLLWIVANVPRTYRAVGAGASGHAMPPLSVELKNSFHFAGYTAPCPGPTDQRRYVARVYAMPHPTTSLFLSGEVRARDVQAQLQKWALCISSTELPFSYAASVVTPSQSVATPVVAAVEDVVPGEVTMG